MKLGTPLSSSALRVMLLGAGELGKEGNNKGQTTVSDARIGTRAACEIAEANNYNESHC